MMPDGVKGRALGGYQPIKDPTAHIKIPEATLGDMAWAQSMEGKWKRGLSQELAKVSRNGYIWRVKYLLDLKDKNSNRKVDIYKSVYVEGYRRSSLCHAIDKKNYNTIELLLSSGGDPNIDSAGASGTAYRAAYAGDEKIWRALFKHNLSIERAVEEVRRFGTQYASLALEGVLREMYPEQLENYGLKPLRETLPPTEDSETEVAVKSVEKQEVSTFGQGKTELSDASLSKTWERVAGSHDEIVHTSRIENSGTLKQTIFNFKERSVTSLFQTNGVMATPVIRNFKDIEGEDSLFEAYAELEKQGAKPPVFLGQDIVTVGKNTPKKKRVSFS